jgi:hypothetical protein
MTAMSRTGVAFAVRAGVCLSSLSVAVALVGCPASGSTGRPVPSRPADAASDATTHPTDAGTDVDAACVDTETDPRNCGTCGMGCNGGECRGGVCAPLSAGVLSSGQHTPVGLALDATNVYWLNVGTYLPDAAKSTKAQLMKCAKTGCGNAPTVLASGQWNGTTRLVVSGGYVYWATQNLLLRCATDGCVSGGPTVLWASSLSPTDVAANETAVYFGDKNTDDLLACPLDGCAMGPTMVWTSGSPVMAMVADRSTVYAAISQGSLLSCAAGGCSGGLLFAGAPTAIAKDAGHVYLGHGIPGGPIALTSFPEADASSQATDLVDDLTACAGIATDGANVYYTDWGTIDVDAGSVPDGAGRVAKCAIAGCGGVPTPVAGFVNFPQQIAVDDTNVYWTDFGSIANPNGSDDGRVVSVPK